MSLCVSVIIVQCAMCGGVAVAPITCPTHSICIRDHIPIAYNNIIVTKNRKGIIFGCKFIVKTGSIHTAYSTHTVVKWLYGRIF